MKEMKELIELKVKDLKVDIVNDVIYIDFDDIGNLWNEVFEEVFEREMDDLIDQDVDDFEKVQDMSMDIISKGGTFEVEFDY